MSRLRLDVIALLIVVLVALRLGHGRSGWGCALIFFGALLAGAAVGLLGRRYPWIYGRPKRRR
jgi:hypothetical protein